jgi:hypothetical protein
MKKTIFSEIRCNDHFPILHTQEIQNYRNDLKICNF